MTDNHKLVNQIKKERHLAAIRSEVLAADSQQALDTILGSPTPATLVQSFPDQDFHFLMHTIGPHDFLPVLALASFDQWEYLIDIETWEGDRVNLPMVTEMLALLFAADPERFVRWMILEKTEFFELYLFKNMEVRVLQENEDPSDFPDGFQTIDNLFYVRFPEIPQQILEQEEGAQVEQARKRAETFIMAVLNRVADMDLSVSHGLLLETGTVIPAEIEEEELRLKVFRLAEKGFLPRHEAVGIYQPKDVDSLRPRPAKVLEKNLYGGDYPLPPLFFSSLVGTDNLFARSLSGIGETMGLNLQAEFAGLVNRISSADGGVVRERQDLERLVQKGCAFLSLGMEIIHGDASACTPREGAAIIIRYPLSDIFRVASRACLTLKTRAKGWYDQSWLASNDLPLHFLGEQWLGVVGGLLLDRPLFFDSDQPGLLYRPFAAAGEITATDKHLGSVIAIDRVMAGLDPDLGDIPREGLTFKPVVLTLWARDRLGLDHRVEAIERSVFLPFFVELFSGEIPGTIDGFKRDDFTGWLAQQTGLELDGLTRNLGDWIREMFDQLEQDYGRVRADDLESRFVIDFFLKG